MSEMLTYRTSYARYRSSSRVRASSYYCTHCCLCSWHIAAAATHANRRLAALLHLPCVRLCLKKPRH